MHRVLFPRIKPTSTPGWCPFLHRSEWTNLFEFIQAKQLRIENFKEAQRGPGAAAITSYAELEGGDMDAGAQYLAVSLCLLSCTEECGWGLQRGACEDVNLEVEATGAWPWLLPPPTPQRVCALAAPPPAGLAGINADRDSEDEEDADFQVGAGAWAPSCAAPLAAPVCRTLGCSGVDKQAVAW